ncbi:MAG: hypothetical protein QM754_16090 [Tepidisphaeraceae bacterium]
MSLSTRRGFLTAGDINFDSAYRSALNAAAERAPDNDHRYAALIAIAGNGVDYDLVWRAYLPLIGRYTFPTVRPEFPANWPYYEAGIHRRLVTLLWRKAKSQAGSDEGKQNARAALALAGMRREDTALMAIRTIITDQSFDRVLQFEPNTSQHLKTYWSDAFAVLSRSKQLVNEACAIAASEKPDRALAEEKVKTLCEMGGRFPVLSYLIADSALRSGITPTELSKLATYRDDVIEAVARGALAAPTGENPLVLQTSVTLSK